MDTNRKEITTKMQVVIKVRRANEKKRMFLSQSDDKKIVGGKMRENIGN